MESWCWGREAKSCLSEFSGCRSLLKCQVLLKNNTPLSPHTHHHPHLLPLSQPYCLPSRTKPRSSQWWHTGWGMNPGLDSTSGQTPAFLLPSEVLIHLFISPTTTTSPPWPPRWKQRRWWNEIISFPLFSLSSHRHSSPLDSFYFIRGLFWLFSWCGAWSHRPQNITSTIKPICSVRGSHIWQITYTSTVELLPRQDVMEILIIRRCERQ